MIKSIDGQNMAKISTFLGIDFGKAKIGLAIADEETRMAFAFDVLKNDNQLIVNLKEIVECENVTAIIIGTTKHENDSQGALVKLNFAKKIEKELNVKIHYHDEIFTTKIAQANLIAKGLRNVGKKDDSEAARIILQSWLDKDNKMQP